MAYNTGRKDLARRTQALKAQYFELMRRHGSYHSSSRNIVASAPIEEQQLADRLTK